MACGVPIVTTRRGGNPEVIDGTGAGVVIDNYTSAEEFSSVLESLLSSPDTMRAMSEAARRLAVQRFGWDRVAGELWEVCRTAAAHSDPVPPGETGAPGAEPPP